MVARPELTDGEHRRAGSCLAYGFNETEGQGPDGELHCDYYVDKDDVERRSTWQGTTREAVLAKYGRTVESEEE